MKQDDNSTKSSKKAKKTTWIGEKLMKTTKLSSNLKYRFGRFWVASRSVGLSWRTECHINYIFQLEPVLYGKYYVRYRCFSMLSKERLKRCRPHSQEHSSCYLEHSIHSNYYHDHDYYYYYCNCCWC